MIKFLSRLKKDQKGQALVEFALILPILILLVMGIIEFGIIYHTQLVLDNASREGARAGVLQQRGEEDSASSDDKIKEVIFDRAATLDRDKLEQGINISPDFGDRRVGVPLKVELTYEVNPFTPVISNIIGDSIELNSSTTMRVE